MEGEEANLPQSSRIAKQSPAKSIIQLINKHSLIRSPHLRRQETYSQMTRFSRALGTITAMALPLSLSQA
ncbi:hypothetical protein FGO68_gene8054 [Halteria grandinella]|uniref:Uncharacterized protein n=1 Tax=Halteria grandinella TaxID=5974 RepID=A0A8J8P4L6_HALGN|nr:hypothetical protein FGO68_gene8054 [Halteria grandinella]